MLLESFNPVISFQKKLYLDYLKRVYKLTGKKKLDLTNYELEFKRALPKSHVPSNRMNLMDSIKKANVILFGDFHTLINSQNLLLESIKKYRKEKPRAPVVIALEAFSPNDRASINLFLEEKIEEEEFLRVTEYYKKWCFPWPHYKKILLFAKENEIPLIPVNSSLKNVYLRDENISENLFKELKATEGEAKIFCLIGEFHLSEKHLHFKLFQRALGPNKPVKVARVLSNVDEYFFNRKFRDVSFEPSYLELSHDYYCLIDTPPWIKWFTYLQWEEDLEENNVAARNEDIEKNSDYLTFSSSYDDIEFFVGELVKKIASFFRVSVSLDSFFNYHLKITRDPSLLVCPVLATLEPEMMASHLIKTGYFICPVKKTVYYSRLTLGTLVASVGNVLFSLKYKDVEQNSPAEVFSRTLLGFVFSSLCELVFNPYVHASENIGTSIFTCQTKEEAQRILAFLSRVDKSSSEKEVQEEMRRISQGDPFFWTNFSRCFSSLLFHKLLTQSDKTIATVHKEVFVDGRNRSSTESLKAFLQTFIS